jgi:putative copper export protein/methionine-rich copper-binding protein CopC
LIVRALRTAALLLLACALWAAPAWAHLRLQSSTPAQGDTVRTSLTEIRVVFSQAVEPRYTTLALVDFAGNEIALGTLEPVGTGKTTEYVYRLEHPVVSGAFVVRWKTAGEDGHVVSGSFDFLVDVPNAVTVPKSLAGTSADPSAAPAESDEHAHHQPESEIEPLYRPESSVIWILARWINFVGLVLMVGTVAFRFGVLQRGRAALADDVANAIDHSTRNVALVAAVLALSGNLLRFWLQSGALHGTARMWDPELLQAMTFSTGWGKAWLAQTVATIGFVVATRLRTEEPTESWIAAAVFAVAAGATPAFSGHAAAVEQMAVVPIFNDAVHLIAASSWLGTLAVLLFAVPAVIRASHTPFADAAALVRTFSPLALFAAAVAIATGTLSAFVHIKAIPELWTTPYGRTLSLKLAVVLLTATTGAYNWKVVSPRLGSQEATLHIRRSALAEVIIAATIIAVTAVLVALPLH